MPDRVYRVTEVIGVSGESWEAAAQSAVQTAANTVRDLRVADVVRKDVVIENGQVSGFRVRLAISFKYEDVVIGTTRTIEECTIRDLVSLRPGM